MRPKIFSFYFDILLRFIVTGCTEKETEKKKPGGGDMHRETPRNGKAMKFYDYFNNSSALLYVDGSLIHLYYNMGKGVNVIV